MKYLGLLISITFLFSCQNLTKRDSARGDTPQNRQASAETAVQNVKPTSPAPNYAKLPPVSEKKLQQMTADWPIESKSTIQDMVNLHGLPNDVSQLMAVWVFAGPFKRIIVSRTPFLHNEPIPHHDNLFQSISMVVPADKADDLLRFNKSLQIDAIAGELVARCGNEELNLLSLNLAQQIIQGNLTVEQARSRYLQTAKLFIESSPSALRQSAASRQPASTQEH